MPTMSPEEQKARALLLETRKTHGTTVVPETKQEREIIREFLWQGCRHGNNFRDCRACLVELYRAGQRSPGGVA